MVQVEHKVHAVGQLVLLQDFMDVGGLDGGHGELRVPSGTVGRRFGVKNKSIAPKRSSRHCKGSRQNPVISFIENAWFERLSRRIGLVTLLDLTVQRGLLETDQAERVREETARTGESLAAAIVRMGFANGLALAEALGAAFHMEVVDLQDTTPTQDALDALPRKIVFAQACAPFGKLESGGTLVAINDPADLDAQETIRFHAGGHVEFRVAPEDEIRAFQRRHYGVAGDTLEALGLDDEVIIDGGDAALTDSDDAARDASVVRLVNTILLEGIRERATDIHIEPYEDRLVIRYRIDGVLGQPGVDPMVHRFRHAITSRLKIMSNLEISEKRRPQDGRITFKHDGSEYDLRVSIIPMLHGEGVVLRVLDKTTAVEDLEELGMDQTTIEPWDVAIKRPYGILLVTGPTGSGKSTTLYASLARIVTDEIKCITVEDPVEYHVEGVNQIPVHRRVGLDFASGLRAILRHDPDVVMIGEIRDRETAEAAVQASLTGHLVFSTLHTNSAVGAPPRLLDMGVEPFLVASSLEAVLAQRLVRRLCLACRKPTGRPEAPYEAGGCRECRDTGYRGRHGVYELLPVDEDLRTHIMARAGAGALAEEAARKGMRTLAEHGQMLVEAGITSDAEIARVTAG